MKYLDIFVCWLSWLAVSSAQSSTPLPSCALGCLGQQLPFSGCVLTDIACQCASRNLTVSTAACMLANCTMADTLALSKFQAGLCKNPIQDKSQLVVAVFVAITAVAVIFVFLRLISGPIRGSKLGLEDWIVTVALILAVPPIAITFKMASEGFGKHLYSLEDGDLLRFLRDFYIAENIYVVVLAVTKISILSFYLRIFQHQYWFRAQVWVTICLIGLSTTIISILTVFQCHPIDFFWNRDKKGGICLDVNALAYANSAMSMVQDIMITLMPIHVVFQLNMSLQKKIGVAVMFALGGFGCIVSAIRLRVLLGFGNSMDPTWDYVYVVIWTAMELGVAIILSCLPAVRLLVISVFANTFTSSIRSLKNNVSGQSSDRPRQESSSRKNEFLELRDVDPGMTRMTRMTHMTVNGEEYQFPKKPPPVPMKDSGMV